MIDVTRNNTKLNNREVGEILICLLYVSSENTALGLTSTLLDLSRNPNYWKGIKENTTQAIHDSDYRSIFSDRLVDACVMESARMNSHIFALNRQPMTGINTLGEYFVGDVDSVALCEPMLMIYEAAADKFSNPEVYNPNRDKDRISPDTIPHWFTSFYQIMISLIAYDFIFFVIHRILHTKYLYFIHKKHHEYKNTVIWADAHTDFIDVLLVAVFPNIIIGIFVPMHLYTQCMFIIVSISLGISQHSNLNLPYSPFYLIPFCDKIFGSYHY